VLTIVIYFQGVLICPVKEFICRDKHIIRYNGQDDNIFFNSTSLGIGEELFWDFHGWFNFGKLSFTKFCSQKTEQYKSTNPNSLPFVSNHTFIELFFSWVVRLGIDFRKEVDPWCGYDPTVLACDGTHIGVSLKLQDLQDPITRSELEDQQLPAIHKKDDRCFLPYPQRDTFSSVAEYERAKLCTRNARFHLLTLCSRILKEDIELFEIEDDKDRAEAERKEESDRQDMFATLVRLGLNEENSFITKFIAKELPLNIQGPAAKVLKMLLKTDAAISNLLPFRYHQELKECLDAAETCSPNLDKFIKQVRFFGTHLADLIKVSARSEHSILVVNFLRYLLNEVVTLHSQDRDTAPAVPIPHTYNPPSGTAYYFTETGDKLREQPCYLINDTIDKKSKGETCTKIFPKVSSGGFGYMFLFFCPIHGHCYGFHLVDGAEGRKDPFSALYKYKPSPPEELFYDFACQLNEYCLNREPMFFRMMRVWHDIFHGFNHICVPCFKSTRVLGLTHVNSEICEQFNSYLQSIKYTGSHLSQINFMLFSQFMIFLWNRQKTERFKAFASVALRGLD